MSTPTLEKKHDFHLVDPSPWPFLASMAAFVAAIGFLIFLHSDEFGDSLDVIVQNYGVLVLVPGIAGLCLIAFLWWRDVIQEADQAFTPTVQIGLRYGMLLFIFSEIAFFVSFFWAFFGAALFPMDQPYDLPGGVWPPANIATVETFGLPFINTLILLLSSATLTWSHHALREGNRTNFIFALTITVLLGVIFLGLQVLEYSHLSFGFSDGIYPSVFYMATGFHGFHVFVGAIFLGVCLIRSLNGAFSSTKHFGFEAASWYWHFVDVVWIFLFIIVYFWGG